MAHDRSAHAWGPIYELDGTSYRECIEPDRHGHQEWICVLDRWSDAFESPSPRTRLELVEAGKQERTRTR